MKQRAKTIAAAIGAESKSEAEITSLLTDSRDLGRADQTIFFALRTAGNDGHKYIPALLQAGVKHFVVDKNYDEPKGTDAEFWKTDDALEALQATGAAIRQAHRETPVIGITGSRGKTVAKELIARLLAAKFNITRSPRSFNSQIGVPLSVCEIDEATQLGIFEAGISATGEMDALQRVMRPTIGVFTSLTEEHSEGFGSMEEKAEEKAKLFRECSDVFYPAGERLIENALNKARAEAKGKMRLHPVEGDIEDLAAATASFTAKEEIDASPIRGMASKISARIDVTETLNDCLIIYDGFSCHTPSLEAAINQARRHAAQGRSISLALGGGYFDLGQEELEALTEGKGISRIIKARKPIDFIENYSIKDFREEAILVCGPAEEGFEDIKTHLEAPRHDTVMEVNLRSIVENFNLYRSKLPQGTGLIAMVKASGYGIGALELSKTMQSQGAAYLAVAVVDEGAELRRGGVTMPIIVMNPITNNYKALFANRLEPSVFCIRELEMLISEAKRLGVTDYPIHIKLDTGMHRVGFLSEEIPELLRILNSQSQVKASTIFSHLATADCLDQDAYTEGQLQAFKRMSDEIIAGLPYRPKRHILNTAGIMRYPEHHYDFARLGIGLYGVSPIPTEDRLSVVASLHTTIISIRHWDEGATIGYGRKGKVTGPSVIATIPIGYADGLDRHLSNGGASFLVNGKMCPVIGNICMDQCMIDVTGAEARIGDRVEIFGENAGVERLSDALGTIPYEIFTSISPRVKRIYYRE
ncbi:MAG: alanine racemase [Clostridium sp.]|nr:alanine racemase [Clostridium sp.]